MNRMNRKTLYIIGGAAAAVLIAVIVLFIALGGNSGKRIPILLSGLSVRQNLCARYGARFHAAGAGQ